MFALRICRPASWMRERVRLRIKSRPVNEVVNHIRVFCRGGNYVSFVGRPIPD